MDEKENVIGTVLRGQIKVECTLIGKLTQGKVVVIPSADLNKFLEQFTTDVYSKAEIDEKLKEVGKINNNSDTDKFFDWLKERNYNLKNFKGLEKTFPVLTFIPPDFSQPKVGESVIHGTGSPNTIIEFDGKKYEVDDNGNWTITLAKPFEKGITHKLNYYDYADKLNTLDVVAISEYSIPSEDNVTVVTSDIVSRYDLKGDVILPPTVMKIDEDAFTYNDDIKSVKSLSATIIGDYAFVGCTNLTSVSFPSVTMIGNDNFLDCKKLKMIIINEKIDKTDVLVIALDCIVYNQDKTKKFNINSKQWENV